MAVFLTTLALAVIVPAHAQSYSVTDLGTLSGGTDTFVTGINNAGTIVGYANLTSGLTHAFSYSNGVMTDLGTLPGGSYSYATAINSSGTITGYATTGSNQTHAFSYSNGTMTDLEALPGGFQSYAYAVNDSGIIAGDSGAPGFAFEAVSFGNGQITNLGTFPGGFQSEASGINKAGTIVGQSIGTSNGNVYGHAFSYSNGTMTDLGVIGSGSASSAAGINSGGTVVGASNFNASSLTHAFSFSNGTMTDLGTLPGGNISAAFAINSSGTIVGQGTDSTGAPVAFVYAGGQMTALDSLVSLPNNSQPLSYPGNGQQAFGVGNIVGQVINDPGQIVVDETVGTHTHAMLLTPIVSTARLVNLSARANVGIGSNILIAGFVISGTGSKSMLIRGVGPALNPLGIADYLAQPSLALFNSQSVEFNSNTGWGNNPALTAAFSQVGAFAYAAGSADSALQVSLPANQPVTAEVSGVNGGTGVSLAELYDADPNFLSSPTRLVNISARADVGTGANILIAGFVIGGAGNETVLIRAIGPTLGTLFALTGVLTNPVLTLFDSKGNVITSNQGWQNPPATPTGTWAGQASPADATHATFASVGAFDLSNGTADSALVVTLPAGAYTAEISGSGNGTGVALVEVYEDN